MWKGFSKCFDRYCWNYKGITNTTKVINKRKEWEFEAQEESTQDSKQKFKLYFHYAVLDKAIQSFDLIFLQLQEYFLFGFLYDIYSINNTVTEIL